MGTRGDTCVHTRAPDGVAEVIILHHEARPARDLGGSFLAATLLGAEQVDTAQWAKSGFFVQWVYWVYLSSQNTRPLCNAAMYEQV